MADIRERSTINNSTSKQQFAFSKASRFPSPKQNTHAFGYEVKEGFGQTKALNAGFGVREDRFGYEEFKKHQRGVGKIDTPDVAAIDATKNKTFSYSFGVSRSAMKKVHVDEILKKREENLPGPDRYGKKDTFGANAQSVSYSMRKKLGAFDRHLKREKMSPGPGYYQSPDLVGTGLTSSIQRTAVKNSFPKSTDRFRPPKQQSPAVTTYQVRDEINQNFNSVRTYVGATKIGTNKKNFMDDKWYLDRAANQPGPGSYARFSDFGGIN